MDILPILLMPAKTDDEFDKVSLAWAKRGGEVNRLGKFWIKDDVLASKKIAIYGGQAFALVLAQIYNVELVSPDDSLIARLDNKWVKRKILLKQIGKLKEKDFPAFIKPVIPKTFPAGILQSFDDFKIVAVGLQDTERILASNIIEIDAEARGYIMDGDIKDVALYEGVADIETGRGFLTEFINNNKLHLPAVVVVDIAFNKHAGWFVLEFNACWGAGLNNCNADKVIDCIIGATVEI